MQFRIRHYVHGNDIELLPSRKMPSQIKVASKSRKESTIFSKFFVFHIHEEGALSIRLKLNWVLTSACHIPVCFKRFLEIFKC